MKKKWKNRRIFPKKRLVIVRKGHFFLHFSENSSIFHFSSFFLNFFLHFFFGKNSSFFSFFLHFFLIFRKFQKFWKLKKMKKKWKKNKWFWGVQNFRSLSAEKRPKKSWKFSIFSKFLPKKMKQKKGFFQDFFYQ